MIFPRVSTCLCMYVCVYAGLAGRAPAMSRGSPGSGGAGRSVPGASARAAPPGSREPRPQRPLKGARLQLPSSRRVRGGPGAAAFPGTLRGRGSPITPS